MKFTLSKKKEFPENGEFLFRYESDNYYASDIKLVCNTYYIVKRTPKGVWIVPENEYRYLNNLEEEMLARKFVRNDGKKRFAYETRELALNAFLHRKRRQIQILKTQLKKAEQAYVLAGGTQPSAITSFIPYIDYY